MKQQTLAKEAEFLEECAKFIREVNKEKGCIFFNFHRVGPNPFAKAKESNDDGKDKEDENATVGYVFMERWENLETLNAHLGIGCDKTPHWIAWGEAREKGQFMKNVTAKFCNKSVVDPKEFD